MAMDFVAGCIGGAAGVLAGYPLDTVKVKIQTQDLSKGTPQYNGTFDCLYKIVKAEGGKGLYKGMSSPLYGVAGINAISFGCYGAISKQLSKGGEETPYSAFIAGLLTGGLQTSVVSPVELVKTQMQVRGYSSIGSTIRKIMGEAGYRGLARGAGITLAREVPAFGVYFASNDMILRQFGTSTGAILLAGGTAGVASWVFTYPQDVIKSRLQADGFGARQKYTSALQCAKASYAAEGHRFFVRGLVPTVLRAFPMNAVTFYVYAGVMNAYNNFDGEQVYETLREMRSRREQDDGGTQLQTMCTDMPNIILITEIQRLQGNRAFPEQMLYACRREPAVLTISSSSETTTADNTKNSFYNKNLLNMNQFNQIGADVMPIVPTVLQPLGRTQDEEKEDAHECSKCKEGPHKPSLLATCKAVCTQWKTSITMSDFLLPYHLRPNNGTERIYGFYYLVA